MKCPGEPYQKGFPAALTHSHTLAGIMLISGDADGISAGADVIWQMGSVMPVYWGLSNRLVLVKCTLRWLCRVFIVPLRNTDNLRCLLPLAAGLHLFVQGKSIIWNDQISAALILSLYSVWHSLQLRDRESSRQCVWGTALFWRMLFVGEREKRLGYYLCAFSLSAFPGAVIMVSTCGHGRFVPQTVLLSRAHYYSMASRPRRGIGLSPTVFLSSLDSG